MPKAMMAEEMKAFAADVLESLKQAQRGERARTALKKLRPTKRVVVR